MFAYWMMFALAAMAVVSPMRSTVVLRRVAWWAFGAMFTLMIGFRHRVGGDWGAYFAHYELAAAAPLRVVLGVTDPAYAFLNWVAGQIDGQIYTVNLICGAILMTGVISFCRRQPLPWLALLVAVPYMIIVVGMGYTRQSVAIGFELLALVAMMDNRVRRFVLFVLCGALFHKSALIMLPVAVLASKRNRMWKLLWVGVTGMAAGTAILAEHYEQLWQNYVVAEMVSEGGPVRIAMNAVPAVLLLIYGKKLAPEDNERRLWWWIAIFSVACIPLVGLASTAVDRAALYFMPLQLFVFPRFHRLFGTRILKTAAVLLVVLGYGGVLWVWLNFATHAFAWRPYQFYPFVL